MLPRVAADAIVGVRWAVMHGLPRFALPRRAARGDRMAQLLLGYEQPGAQYPRFEELRAQGRLVHTAIGAVTCDLDICKQVLRHEDFTTIEPADFGLPRPLVALLERTDPHLPNPVEPPSMLVSNPPAHTAYRHPIARTFTPKAIAQLTDRAEELAVSLLDDAAGKRSVDLVADYAALLPVAMIGRLLGLPEADDPFMLQWGEAAAPLLDPGLSWPVYRRAQHALRSVQDYLQAHFDRVKAEAARTAEDGAGDGASQHPFALLAAGGELTDRELIANAALLIGAGFETTVNLIGNGIVLLLEHPDQLARLREDPSLWPNAVEEILRFSSPVQRTARVARRDVEIDGVALRDGTVVSLLLAAANRDPSVFDRPDEFDVAREEAKRNVSFGYGIHACIGAALARMEGAVALRTLFERFPDVRLDGAPQHRGLVTLCGYSALPARLA